MNTNIVKLVCIASAVACGVEVLNIEGKVLKTFLVEPITEQPTPEAIRAKLNTAIEKLGSDYTVVAPSRYKLLGAVTAKDAGLPRDALHGYESFQVRDDWTPEIKKRAQAQALSVEQVLKLKTCTTGAIEARKGKQTKASLVRSIISEGLTSGHSTETMVANIVKATSFAVQLARVYFKENLKKVYAATQELAAAEAAASEAAPAEAVRA
jgi:hypothetical protein